jgi:uncharacterized protein (DUF2141 family)
MIVAAMLLASQVLASNPTLGTAEGRCRPEESGPAFLVTVVGLKDRRGSLKLELYPANDADFLADDNILVAAGKPFRRVEMPVPQTGPVQLCIRAPSAGTFALSVLHDRVGSRKFNLSADGVGFGGNPALGFSKPKAATASVDAGPHPTSTRIVLNYRRGLFSFGPIGG